MDERQTMKQCLQSWLESMSGQVEPSSWRRYSDYVRVHLVPLLGKVPIAKLSAQQVQAFYGCKQHEGLSGTTVHSIHGMLHRALEDAVRLGLVQRNVTGLVRPPRRSTQEIRPLTEEQAQRFLAAAAEAAVAGDRFHALYILALNILALTTGMREGELLALHWQDVDFQAGTVRVRLGLQEAKGPQGRYILSEPKTEYSKRTIGLPPTAIEALHAQRTRLVEERLRLGAAWDTSRELVFPNTIGGLMIPDNLTKRSFKPLLKRAGLPDIRFHDPRHTAATLPLARGVNVKLMSEMLGHADVTTTLRIYGHVLPHMHHAAVAVMQQVFGA